eukprot:jgi/Ulvmu1/8120/UM040_0015.1
MTYANSEAVSLSRAVIAYSESLRCRPVRIDMAYMLRAGHRTCLAVIYTIPLGVATALDGSWCIAHATSYLTHVQQSPDSGQRHIWLDGCTSCVPATRCAMTVHICTEARFSDIPYVRRWHISVETCSDAETFVAKGTEDRPSIGTAVLRMVCEPSNYERRGESVSVRRG